VIFSRASVLKILIEAALSRKEKKFQKKIIFGFQWFPKGGVDPQAVHLFYDGLFFDEQACVLKQLELHPQHISGAESAQ
jgi:hypothetical protein